MANNVVAEMVAPGDIQTADPAMRLHVYGSKDLPMVEATLQPGARMLAEPGRMVGCAEGVKFSAVMGDGSPAGMFSKMMSAASRAFSGESVMLAAFENESDEPKVVRFGTVVPGNLIHLNLRDYGGEIIGMSGVYLLGSSGIKIASCFRQKLGAAFFGGESFILQKLSGEGDVILQAGGAVLHEELTPERPMIRVDTGCLVAFTGNLVYNIALAGGLKSMLFGGEGLFHATISLPPGQTKGTVWIESFPYSKFISIIKSKYPH